MSDKWKMKSYPCETCRFRRHAEKNPDSLLAKFWNWHTKWCPGWKAYQKHLREKVRELSPQDTPRD